LALLAEPVRGWIEAALKGSGWTADEIWRGIRSGDFHLFIHPEGCMVGEFIVSPRHRVMHIFAAGGTLKAMDDLGPTVEAFGRLHNCDMASATGRRGWQRHARKHGYQPADPVIWKEL
jgi:hypothetical protein